MFGYLLVLAGCLACALWLEPLLRVGVLRQVRRLVLTIVPVAAVFVLWDLAAVRAGHWSFDRRQVLGVWLPGGLPLEELLFFLVVPLCAILALEGVRAIRAGRGGALPGRRPNAAQPPSRGEGGAGQPRTGSGRSRRRR